MEERLQKLLSGWGIASRRQAEQMILDGRVTVNGAVAALGDRADPERDEICLDGKPLGAPPEKVYLMLHKPRGFVTTMQDEQGRPTAAELVADCPTRVYPVGRLDLYSEGLLLFTNDGEAANRLTHPRHQVEKTYEVWVSNWKNDAGYALKQPIALEEGTVQAQAVRVLNAREATAKLEIVITEGKNRQIRRMCQTVGLTVTRLRRVGEGALCLGDLPKGTWRYLSPEEIAWLKNI